MLPLRPSPFFERLMSAVKAQTVCLIKTKTAALSIRILGSIGSRLYTSRASV